MGCYFTFYGVFFLLSLTLCWSTELFYTLNLTDGEINPACVSRPGILINGQFPGPTIKANVGDSLLIQVINSMEKNSITIHWHGIHQKNTSFFDGVSGATQCEIKPGQTFTYSFGLFEQEGTYWYHAHHQLWGGIVYGALIIYNETRGMTTPYGAYDEELILLLSDFFQKSEHDMHHGLFNESFQWIGDPDAILINGKSVINCSTFNFPTHPTPEYHSSCIQDSCQYPVIDLHPNRTYRIRVIGATFLSHLSFAIDDHNFDIVEADGYFVEKKTTNLLLVNSGERYSIIIRTKSENELKNNSGWWGSARIRWRPGDPRNGLVFFHYITNSSRDVNFNPPPPAPIVISQNWNETVPLPYTLRGSKSNSFVPPVPKYTNRTILLTGRHERVNNIIKWTINHIATMFPDSSSLLPFIYENKTDLLKNDTYPIELKYGEVIDVVFQNAAALNGVCEQHPWHIHGHSFYILGYGPGNYTTDQSSTFNLEDPPYRDQVTAYPWTGAWYQPKLPIWESCGWTAVRFIADNPGVWSLHCHIHAHMDMGMMVTFAESTDRLSRLPLNVVRHLQTCYNFSPSFLASYDQPNESNSKLLAIVLPIVLISVLVLIVLGVYFLSKQPKNVQQQELMM